MAEETHLGAHISSRGFFHYNQIIVTIKKRVITDEIITDVCGVVQTFKSFLMKKLYMMFAIAKFKEVMARKNKCLEFFYIDRRLSKDETADEFGIDDGARIVLLIFLNFSSCSNLLS